MLRKGSKSFIRVVSEGGMNVCVSLSSDIPKLLDVMYIPLERHEFVELGGGRMSGGEDDVNDGRRGASVSSEQVCRACLNTNRHLAMKGGEDRQPAMEGGRSRRMEALGERYMHMAMQREEGTQITTQAEGKRRKALQGAGDGHTAVSVERERHLKI